MVGCSSGDPSADCYSPPTLSHSCTEGGCECKTGFDATPGWDASTGLGTPNYGRLVEAMDAIDDRRERLIAGQQQ